MKCSGNNGLDPIPAIFSCLPVLVQTGLSCQRSGNRPTIIVHGLAFTSSLAWDLTVLTSPKFWAELVIVGLVTEKRQAWECQIDCVVGKWNHHKVNANASDLESYLSWEPKEDLFHTFNYNPDFLQEIFDVSIPGRPNKFHIYFCRGC